MLEVPARDEAGTKMNAAQGGGGHGKAAMSSIRHTQSDSLPVPLTGYYTANETNLGQPESDPIWRGAATWQLDSGIFTLGFYCYFFVMFPVPPTRVPPAQVLPDAFLGSDLAV